MLTEAPILSYPNADAPFLLDTDTDASNHAIGAVLSKCQEGQERVIAYYSRTLSAPEKHYCVTRKELLAVVQAVQHFHSYLMVATLRYAQTMLHSNGSSISRILKVKWPDGSRDCKNMTLRSNTGKD